MQDIIFWQNFPNHLQSSLIRSLSQRAGMKVTLVCQQGMAEWRRDMGWELPDFGNTKLIISPDENTINALVAKGNERTVHVFSGMRAYPLVWNAFRQSLQTNSLTGIYSESSKWRGKKGLVRLARGRVDALRYRSRIHFILAIGHLGVQWFEKSGYPPEKIYPFPYTVENPRYEESSPPSPIDTRQEPFRLIFIGQLIHRKGVDVLLRALKDIEKNWVLTIVGDGKARKDLQSLAASLKLEKNRVQFTGALLNDEAMKLLVQSDLLVLPSRWDGWGAVVNEALMRGVPVICSDHCGASVIIKADSLFGSVFHSESVEELNFALRDRMTQGSLLPETRKRIHNFAIATLSGEAIASYFLEILDHVRYPGKFKPVPPWTKVIV